MATPAAVRTVVGSRSTSLLPGSATSRASTSVIGRMYVLGLQKLTAPPARRGQRHGAARFGLAARGLALGLGACRAENTRVVRTVALFLMPRTLLVVGGSRRSARAFSCSRARGREPIDNRRPRRVTRRPRGDDGPAHHGPDAQPAPMHARGHHAQGRTCWGRWRWPRDRSLRHPNSHVCGRTATSFPREPSGGPAWRLHWAGMRSSPSGTIVAFTQAATPVHPTYPPPPAPLGASCSPPARFSAGNRRCERATRVGHGRVRIIVHDASATCATTAAASVGRDLLELPGCTRWELVTVPPRDRRTNPGDGRSRVSTATVRGALRRGPNPPSARLGRVVLLPFRAD